MGRTAASSKHKSSNKKKSKLSSQTRRKKTSKRNKSKRVYSDDSVSSYSDESLRSLSVSLSDSEDGNVGRKGRSRVRDKVKSSKKRVRRSSSSDDSSVDVKVRKRSKRIGDSKVRKKTHKKKKRKIRRKVSVSSSSSDSGILRTRRHDSSSGTEESEHERKRGRSRKRKSDKTSSGRIGSKKSRLRSRSCSSCSRYSDNSDDVIKDNATSEIDQNREIVTSEILPRRLKSVITVVRPQYEEEVTGQDKDENKEEIFYDQDDYPSCRSNDSNDGGKRDLAYKSYNESEKERAEDMVGEEDFSSELVAKESKLSSGDRIDQSDRASIKHPGNKNEIDASTTTAGPGSEDLETILRQKALENLMRFRGPHKNAKPTSHHEYETERNVKSFTAKADDVQNKSSKQELSIGVGETGGRNQQNRRTVRTNPSRFVPTEEMKLDGRDIGIEISAAKQRVVNPLAGVEISGKSSNTSPLMEQPPESSLEKLPQSPVSAHVQGTSPAFMNVMHKSAVEKAETVAGSIVNNENVGVTDACHVVPESSCAKPISEEHNSKQSQDESKGNSFEQKTMSVMRGGEMVQVSYKVYIPNKAPALARRKLQR